MTYQVKEFHINKEYQELIPPLTKQDYDELKEKIKNNGQQVSIVVSDRTGQLVIIDGYHRYKIIQQLGYEPKYEVKRFESEAEELQCIEDCNIKRRHLNTYQRGVTELKIKDRLKEIAKVNSRANLQSLVTSDSQIFVNRNVLGRQGVLGQLAEKARNIT